MPQRGTRNPSTGTDKVRKLVTALLNWFAVNARDLPWRRTKDPYCIYVSEIMLQQTQVKTVIPYWERWLRDLPTIQSAAKASPTKLHKLWEGLGYYTRVRNLQKAAQQIIVQHGGKFPENFDDILALPGIGRYTAGAIASIAFNQPRPILDGNVIRVLTRVFGVTADPREKKTNARLWQLAGKLVQAASEHGGHQVIKPREKSFPLLGERAGVRAVVRIKSPNTCSHLNQSLMELGALVCTSRSPDCQACPVNKLCIARKKGLQESVPNLGKREAATERRFIAFAVECNGEFLVRQRPAGIVNGHLWEFPNVEVGARRCEPQEVLAEFNALRITEPRAEKLAPLCTIKHTITRYRITLEAWRAQIARPSGKFPGRWLTLKQLHRLAFTSAHKKILNAISEAETHKLKKRNRLVQAFLQGPF